MTALAPIGAALGAVGGSAPLVGAATAIGAAGAVVNTISTIQAGRTQAAILQRQAQLDRENAERVRQAAAVQAQDQDLEAAAIIGNEIATAGASGFELSSGSLRRRERSLRVLATRDRLRTIHDGEIQAQGLEEGADITSIRASAARPSFLTVATGGLEIGESLISGANLASSLNARRVQRTARSVA